MSEASDYLGELTKDGPVELKIYGHQVGGHSLLMKFGRAICKPMIPRENFFYTSIPGAIRDFTPIYYGVVSVRFKQTEDGKVHLLAVPQSSSSKEEEEEGGGRKSENGPVSGVGGVANTREVNGKTVVGEVETLALSHPIVRLDFLKATDGFANNKHEKIVERTTGGTFANPWSAACMENVQSVLSHYQAHQLKSMFQDYLVLEDLTRKYECPCILDLKIGTRQHGDDQSDEKKRQHMARCASSTSSRLGVRISGMQIYNVAKGVFSFRDKYYGRQLNPEGFHDALRDFLHNGTRLRTDLLPTIIAMLTQLREMIKQQDSFRFFSSSLLVMYDGHVESEEKSPDSTGAGEGLDDPRSPKQSAATSLKEPACQTLPDTCGSERAPSPAGQLPTVASAGEDRTHGKDGRVISERVAANGLDTVKDGEREGEAEEEQSSRSSSQSQYSETLADARKIADVRMIDFAHTTHGACVRDPVKYTGPDDGYLLGLSTLISAFRKFGNL